MKTRIIHTRFFQDSYILTLKPLERWFFLYLISNERVEKTGAYELPLQIASLETGLSIKEMTGFLRKFQDSKKIYYVDSFVIIKNILKYQDYSKGSPKQVQSYNKELDSLPISVSNIILDKEGTSSQLVTNQLQTGLKLDINNKERIINNKEEIIKDENKKISTVKLFEENIEEIIESTRKLYPDKNVEKAKVDFLGYIKANKNKYKDFKQAFYNWVREDRFKKYNLNSTTIGQGKMSIDIN